MLEKGFVMLHRSILNWEWYDDISTKTLFLHLLLTANWQDENWHGMTVRRGQRVCTVATLAQETNLTVRNVRTAISHLKATNELTNEPTSANAPKSTVFTLLNYEKYQSATKETTNQRQVIDKSPTNYRQQLNNYNNYNNAITQEGRRAPVREKLLFGTNVFLTRDQYDLLIYDYGKEDTDEMIEILSRYKIETGKEYESDYHAITKWVADKLAEERKKKSDPLYGLDWKDISERPPGYVFHD